jgi:hypothetical protein
MINPPPFQNDRPVMEFFNSIFVICGALTQSGTVRPTKNLWIGRMFFDTTLGKPIWYENPDWVDATGTVV